MFTLDHLNLQLLLEWQVAKIHGLIGARCGELHFVSHELYACNVDRFNYAYVGTVTGLTSVGTRRNGSISIPFAPFCQRTTVWGKTRWIHCDRWNA